MKIPPELAHLEFGCRYVFEEKPLLKSSKLLSVPNAVIIKAIREKVLLPEKGLPGEFCLNEALKNSKPEPSARELLIEAKEDSEWEPDFSAIARWKERRLVA